MTSDRPQPPVTRTEAEGETLDLPEETPTNWTEDPFQSRVWGEPTTYQQPRRYEVGFSVAF